LAAGQSRKLPCPRVYLTGGIGVNAPGSKAPTCTSWPVRCCGRVRVRVIRSTRRSAKLVQAIGERACRAGNSVFFISAQRLFAQLRGARADQSYEKKLLRFTTPEVLVIDDLGLRPLEREEPLDLFEIIRARYEVGSMIITSNRALEEWYGLFPDDLMASAAMDRLLHHAEVVVLEGQSYRNPSRKAS
jgi:DNA replication protein DnaC